MSELDKKINEKVETLLSNCDTTGLIYICKKMETPQGKEFCIKRIIQIMEANQHYTFENACADLEVQLTELALY